MDIIVQRTFLEDEVSLLPVLNPCTLLFHVAFKDHLLFFVRLKRKKKRKEFRNKKKEITGKEIVHTLLNSPEPPLPELPSLNWEKREKGVQ